MGQRLREGGRSLIRIGEDTEIQLSTKNLKLKEKLYEIHVDAIKTECGILVESSCGNVR